MPLLRPCGVPCWVRPQWWLLSLQLFPSPRCCVRPPPLEQVRRAGARVKRYTGVPVAPQARRNRIDQNLWILQQKLEIAMHLLIDALETGEPTQIDLAAAEIRSVWEDVLQQRRGLMAGKMANQLDRRPDDDRPRLLSPEEEKRVQQGFSQPKAVWPQVIHLIMCFVS